MKPVFVFGSNLLGRHGAGAAKHALLFEGAVYGVGIGRQGNSYAIPTKETPYRMLPLSEIHKYVEEFIKYAEENPNETFLVTKIGCGLARYTPAQIAPMFSNSPANVILPEEFKKGGR